MKFYLTTILLFIQISLFSQINISGYIEDEDTKERLPGVHIYNAQNKSGTVSNAFGFYSIYISGNDSVKLVFSYTGYTKKNLSLFPDKDREIDIKLKRGVNINEVVVKAEKNTLNTPQMSILKIPIDEIKQIPSIMGEADVLRAFQLMPGVQAGKEGTSGIHVRGGSPDQNLILIDDIPLYYVNHIGGFISVFNPDAIKDITLYKGGFPARYGGRLSSIMDIRMKDGNMKNVTGNFTLGIITGKLTLEGPLRQDKTSYSISVRRSFFDLFTRGFQYLNHQGKFSAGYTLYDLNAKINHIINKKNRLYFSIYSGSDRLFIKQKDFNNSPDFPYKLKSENDLNWGNYAFSLRWNKKYSGSLFSNTTLGYTRFYYNSESDIWRKENETGKDAGRISNHFNSSINDLICKIDFDLYKEKHQIKFGSGITAHEFTPTINRLIQTNNESNHLDTAFGANLINNFEAYFYIEDEFKLTKKLIINTGIRFSYLFGNNYSHFSFEPRLIGNYKLNDFMSFKVSFAKMTQAVHLLSNNGIGLPTDLWVPAIKDAPVQKSNLFALGLEGKILKSSNYNWSVEAYYKKQYNLIEFNEGASFFSGASEWTEKIVNEGTAEVYGLEFLLQKKEGITTGWIAYTLSKNMRHFNSLNSGNPFPYKYDRRHDFSITLNHRFSKRTSLSLAWVFMSGTAITLPQSKYNLYVLDLETKNKLAYFYDDVHIYQERNNYRTPSYNRLDINFNFTKKVTKGIRVFSIGAYNAYNRLNPYYLYFDSDKNGEQKLYSYSLFPIIPSISYNLKF